MTFNALAIRKVRQIDIDRCAATLVAAFDDDPFVNWWVRQGADRSEGMAAAFRDLVLVPFVPLGETYMTTDASGVIVWRPPPGKHVTLPQEWREMMPAVRRQSGRRVRRFEFMVRRLEEAHPDTPHWFLFVIGVHPSRQGQGIGSALIRHMTQRLDRDGMPSYLQSSKERNVPVYGRHGFQVLEKMRIGSNGPYIWRMWREPK